MTVLPATDIEKLLAEDAPYGDLTTDALGLGAMRGKVRFAARPADIAVTITCST